VRQFVDDTALYLNISTSSQSEVLQKDLDNLERWSLKWDMVFNPSKRQVIETHLKLWPAPPWSSSTKQSARLITSNHRKSPYFSFLT